MGDVLSLILRRYRKQRIDRAQAEKLATKLKRGRFFDLNDFLDQLKQMKKLWGHMASMLSKMPGMSQVPDAVKSQMDDSQF